MLTTAPRRLRAAARGRPVLSGSLRKLRSLLVLVVDLRRHPTLRAALQNHHDTQVGVVGSDQAEPGVRVDPQVLLGDVRADSVTHAPTDDLAGRVDEDGTAYRVLHSRRPSPHEL